MPFCPYSTYESLLRYIIYRTAPILSGLKPAELVTLRKCNGCCLDTWKNCRAAICRDLGISCRELRENGDAVLLFFYCESMLSDTLSAFCGHPLLLKCGYPECADLQAILDILSYRFRRQGSFPHEIGLFLGYPRRDVEAFVDGSKACCFCGYWKVYSEPFEARRLMCRIAGARRFAALLLLSGLEVCHALAWLRDSIFKF